VFFSIFIGAAYAAINHQLFYDHYLGDVGKDPPSSGGADQTLSFVPFSRIFAFCGQHLQTQKRFQLLGSLLYAPMFQCGILKVNNHGLEPGTC